MKLSAFSIPNENNFIDLILYGSHKFDDKKNYNTLMKSSKVLIDLTRTCYNFFGIVKRMRVLFMCIF